MRTIAIYEIMETILEIKEAHTEPYTLATAGNARGKVSLAKELGLISKEEYGYYNRIISEILNEKRKEK